MKTRTLLKAWFPVVLWAALIFAGSTDLLSADHTSRFVTPFLRWLIPGISPDAIAQTHFLIRKAGHVTEYTVLAGLLFRAFRGLIGNRWRRSALVFFLAALFAATDEYHQAFVASRTSSLGDICIDCAGAIFGIVICWLLRRVLDRSQPAKSTA